MNGSLPGFDLGEINQTVPQAGSPDRFQRRWRLTCAGLSNVWRFGDLELSAASGRLLLRGLNGTGKTTALEALWPYLLDLNPARLAAGKARSTSLSSLMREGAAGKRRYGYAWLTLTGPDEGAWSFGVRLQYSEGGSPPVRVVPFAVPGRPLHELKLHVAGRGPLTAEQFAEAVVACGGQMFDTEETYLAHLAARIFATPDSGELATLASRLRPVRNPALLGEISPQAAAAALRESLPSVAEDVVVATAEALAESDATREAFARDKEAADLLEDFRAAWCAHAVDVAGTSHAAAANAARDVKRHQEALKGLSGNLTTAQGAAVRAKTGLAQLESDLSASTAEIEALQNHQAYRDAGRLNDLRNTFSAQLEQARAAARAMTEVAHSVAAQGKSLRRELDNIIEDLAECGSQVASADVTAAPVGGLLAWSDQPRSVLIAGTFTADPGPVLVIRGNDQALRNAAQTWQQRADEHALRADAAGVALVDHRQVEAAKRVADESSKAAADAAAKADTESADAHRAEVAAVSAGQALLTLVSSWTRSHPELAEPTNELPDGGELLVTTTEGAWTLNEVDQLRAAESGQVLAAADEWANHALSRAEGLAAGLRADAERQAEEAKQRRGEAAQLRAEAEKLRGGRLLPLPRPEWAGPADDSRALGAALDWPTGFNGDHERALVEAAAAAAGLLGAKLGPSGASTDVWKVEARGPVVRENLGQVLVVDPEHPLAEAATAVLARIRLASSAQDLDGENGTDAGLVVGRDGTFRAGVLQGRVPGADDPALLPAASHVGVRQRRAAALARAEVLDQQADELDARIEELEQQTTRLIREAEATSALGRSFPSREALRRSESDRAQAARAARDARDASERARSEADRLTVALQEAQAEWGERTRAVGLPVDVEQLVFMRDHGKSSAEQLRRAAKSLSGKLADRLRRVITLHDEDAIAQKLVRAESEAQIAQQNATNTQTEVRVLEETKGALITEVLGRLKQATDRRTKLNAGLGPARAIATQAAQDEATAQAKLSDGQTRLAEAQPKAAALLRELRTLLEASGVADAILDGATPAPDQQLLGQVSAALEGRKTIAKKTVRERADVARGKLAGIWSLDPGEDHGELLTYVLTHRDATYTPPGAAAHAATLKKRAEQALAASEEKALREFIIGRLPGAISTAWTRLHDWAKEVNRKMRGAAASSGVGVQVRTPMREDLTPASQTVFQLSCKVSDAERKPEQQKELSQALQALLQAAEGETMQQRVAAAVDVRDWVEVHYEVTRPDGKTQRWNSRTGLSGGERRLVVLAPMLAAIAAAYDRLGEKALRLVALDEVPAEVDERGREGLARYIAELDLDLICTSYSWDGCPGAWDGIDAHDLEAGPDGTVVAFPMLVRGMLPLPEDEMRSGVTSAPAGERGRDS
ncbi:MAG: SbcC/MukB-like Walker B domain-containing protein [Myxococcaceae bacterium]